MTSYDVITSKRLPVFTFHASRSMPQGSYPYLKLRRSFSLFTSHLRSFFLGGGGGLIKQHIMWSLHTSQVAHQHEATNSISTPPWIDRMLVHRRVTPSIKFDGTHLYTWAEGGAVRVTCLAQEHNTMSPTKALTRNTQSQTSADKRRNHQAAWCLHKQHIIVY